MRKFTAFSAALAAFVAAGSSTAFAGTTLSAPLGGALPIAEGGLLGLVAAGVAGGIWLARRKG